MKGTRSAIGLGAALTIFSLALLMTNAWAATKEKVLHNFGNSGDGTEPEANVVFDSAGNLYSTAAYGGNSNNGMVFELVPKAGGGWKEKVLHNFENDGKDGDYPVGGLIFDSSGALYGTTAAGGVFGGGTVFELTPKAGGGWKEKVLYSFDNNGTDGTSPLSSLVFDGGGNLYSTCTTGGAYNSGTVFELTPKAGGGWKEKVLHTFTNDGKDGLSPYSGLVMDAAGNFYGTTSGGGTHGAGTIFELAPKAGGGWTEKVLHSFAIDGKDGYEPVAGLIIDANGSLYGTTEYGGSYLVGQGTAFKLTPKAGGGWTEKVLASFGSDSGDGINPRAGLVFDAAGNLYGTTYNGGAYSDGTVFKLTPKAGGRWKKTLLYTFDQSNGDGDNPGSSLILDAAGNLYGTTGYGGSNNRGTLFEITP